MSAPTNSAYDFTARTLEGQPAPLAEHRGKVLLIVNTASKCGFTPQYAGLEALWRKYQDRGLVVLGFPCNQFGAQEPGDAAEIANFCSLTYDVSFPMMAKIDVNGPAADPLYAWLKGEKKGILRTQGIKWNFTKFLIDREGAVVGRFAPTATPQSLESAVEALI
ncbi:MAG: glutathione peroxidase [Caulobacterales bacterium]